MGFNSKAYLLHEESLLEPGQLLRGNYKGHKELRTSMHDKNKWLNSLSDSERAELKREAEIEEEKLKYK